MSSYNRMLMHLKTRGDRCAPDSVTWEEVRTHASCYITIYYIHAYTYMHARTCPATQTLRNKHACTHSPTHPLSPNNHLKVGFQEGACVVGVITSSEPVGFNQQGLAYRSCRCLPVLHQRLELFGAEGFGKVAAGMRYLGSPLVTQ